MSTLTKRQAQKRLNVDATIFKYIIAVIILLLFYFVEYSFSANTFFVPFSVNGNGPVDLKIDDLGGRHAAFGEWNGDSVYYGYCETDCGKVENWIFTEIFNSGASFGSEPYNIQIQLTSTNQPRIGFQVNGYSRSSEGYYYAACNNNCINAVNWEWVNFAEAGNTVVGNSRWFALDGQGQPLAITIFSEDANYLMDQRVVLNYNYCDINCLNVDSWSSVPITGWSNLGMVPVMKVLDRFDIKWDSTFRLKL